MSIFNKRLDENLDSANNHPSPRVSSDEQSLDPHIQKLIDSLEQKYKQHWFSQHFIDKSVEAEYILLYQKEMVSHSILYIYSIMMVVVVYVTCQIKQLQTTEDFPQFKYVLICSSLLPLIPLFHFALSRLQHNLVLYFASLQTPIFFITLTEMATLVHQKVPPTEGFIVAPILLIQLASLSICSKQMTIAYILTLLYNSIRSHFWIENTFHYVRFNLFCTYLFVMLFILSRRFNGRYREDFKKKRAQRLMLNMFNNLIKVFHDGIIITQQNQIIYENTQVQKIFESSELSKEVNLSKDEELGTQTLLRPTLLQALNLTYLNDKVDSIQEKNLKLWDFMKNPCQKQESMNGLYFKYKDPNFPNRKSKKLQVFSQKTNFGCQKLCMHTVRDMSQWLEIQQEKLLSQFKTVAFAQAAHEFRNPLNGIIQSLDILKGKIDMNKCELSYKVARNCSKLMLNLVNDILDYAQFENNSIKINWEQVQVEPILKECIDIMLFQAKAKGISLEITYDDCAPEAVYSDKQRIRQILINLLSNAIKYTEQGFVKMHVASNQTYLSISVQDSGVGIDAEGRKMLFRTFTKIKQDRHLNKQGCGLGLTICKSIATALKGDILVDSKKGQGSTFSLILPLRPIENTDTKSRQYQNQLFFLGEVVNKRPSFKKLSIPSEEKKTHSLNQLSVCNKQDSELKKPFDKSKQVHTEASKNQLTKKQEEGQDQDQIFNQEEGKNDESSFWKFQDCDASSISDNYLNEQLFQLNINVEKHQRRSSKSLKVESGIGGMIKSGNHSYHRINSWRQQLPYSDFKKNKQRPSTKKLKWHDLISEYKDNTFDSQNTTQCQCAQVLLADDEPFNLIVLESLLEDRGVKCDKVNNGLEAWKQFQLNSQQTDLNHQPYKLLILDNQMPGMTGIELGKEIRRQQVDGLYNHNFHLALLSGHNVQEIRELIESENDGNDCCRVCQMNEIFDFVLEKPLNKNVLEGVLSQCNVIFVQKEDNDVLSD